MPNNDIIIRKTDFGCIHNKYIIDERMEHVECALCGEKLNPMWVLGELCYKEARFNMRIDHLVKVVEKADKKNRCKCEHCSKMTRIQR